MRIGDLVVGNQMANEYSVTRKGTHWIVFATDFTASYTDEKYISIMSDQTEYREFFLRNQAKIEEINRSGHEASDKRQAIRMLFKGEGLPIPNIFMVLVKAFDQMGTLLSLNSNEDALILLKEV